MQITQEQADLLHKHGFQWYRDACTDTVDAECIDRIVPIEDGFAVIYNSKSVFVVSCATIEKIEMPDDIDKQWIRAHWMKIDDFRRPGKSNSSRG
jgi:hypothetical protein